MPPFKPPVLVIEEDRGCASTSSAGAVGGGLQDSKDSWEVQPDGHVSMLGKSLRGDYVFCRERGLIKAAGQDAAFYKVSERDIVLVKQLGAGACATVHKGYHTQMRRFVAIKRVRADNKELRQQMLRDISILSDAQAVPGLLSFLGAYLVPDRDQVSQMAIVLEYMDGGTLADVLKKLGRIPEDVLAVITGQLLQGLVFMHTKHMIHRDIKPANILMSLAGEAKLSDFGISGNLDHTFAQCMTYAGTVTYMSPERLENKPYSFSADIWSLGLVLLECLTGRYPYDADCGPAQLIIDVAHGDPPLPAPGSVSDACRDFLAQCLQKDPLRRPPAPALLTHPWVARAASVNLRGLMKKTMFDPDDRLDEIAYQFSYTYYYSLLGGRAAPGSLSQLAALYLDHSVLNHQGVVCQGRTAILAKLQEVISHQQHGSQPGGSNCSPWQVVRVDPQPLLQTGCVMLLVTGRVALQGAAPPAPPAAAAAAAAGGGGGGVAGGGAAAAVKFSESFILARTPGGEYYVANQVFRLLP